MLAHHRRAQPPQPKQLRQPLPLHLLQWSQLSVLELVLEVWRETALALVLVLVCAQQALPRLA
ncbi:MAG: hypothetical protein VXW25_05645, partial [Pseudomonadota bacterium]|nr:hypothetical protein [Pseudomonadota bacterium]